VAGSPKPGSKTNGTHRRPLAVIKTGAPVTGQPRYLAAQTFAELAEGPSQRCVLGGPSSIQISGEEEGRLGMLD
jgi:hypothetical protein